MTIGATAGKEPDYVEDGDLKTLDEMRGAMKDMHKAKLSLNERATVEGVLIKMDILEQRMEMQGEQMNRLIGMYGTMQKEFQLYREQRIKELNVRVNSGSTSPEDVNGSDS